MLQKIENSEGITKESDNLRDLLVSGDTSAKDYAVLINYNLGNQTLILTMSLQTFVDHSEVANERTLEENKNYEGYEVAQRKLDIQHATKLAAYMLKGFISATIRERELKGRNVPQRLLDIEKAVGKQPYVSLQGVVANIRNCDRDGKGLRFERDGIMIKVWLSDKHVLWIIDGQHRRYAMSVVFDFLKELLIKRKYPKRTKLFASEVEDLSAEDFHLWSEIYEYARTQCGITVEVHLGLEGDQERQLFHDLNNLGKKVEASLAFEYDNSNPINVYIKEDLTVREDEGGFWKPPVAEKDIVDWENDIGAMSRKDIIAVNAHLFLNKTNIKGAQPADVESKRNIADRFWQEINSIPGFGEPAAKKNTIVAQPVVLKALAKLTYDFAFGKHADEETLSKLLEGIKQIDFSHSNPMWRYYQFTNEERTKLKLDGIESYLPSTADGNRDIGMHDGNYMRFGAKHNDIFPIIGDMIRWKLKLPARN